MGSVEVPQVTTQVTTSPSQPSEDIFIHPSCLEFLAPWDRSDSDSIDCSEFEPSTILKMGNEFGVRHGDGGSQSIVYSYPDVDNYLSDNPDFRLLEVGIDGGGSGIFSSIALLERDALNPHKYTVLVRTPSGDRCNDGNKWVSKSTSNGFEFKASATPFRLINPKDTTDWRNWQLAQSLAKHGGKEIERPPVFNEWLPYDDVVNSANACVGWVVRRYDYETGFEIIGVELNPQLATKYDETSSVGCINSWLASQTNEEGSYYDIADWTGRLRQLTNTCGVPSKDTTTASYDCNEAKTDTEVQICSSPELSSLDQRLATLFFSLDSDSRYFESMNADHLDWVKNRRQPNIDNMTQQLYALSYLKEFSECADATHTFKSCDDKQQELESQCLSDLGLTSSAMKLCHSTRFAVYQLIKESELNATKLRLKEDVLASFNKADLIWNEYYQSECSWRWDEVSDGSIRFQVLDTCSTEVIKARAQSLYSMNIQYERHYK